MTSEQDPEALETEDGVRKDYFLDMIEQLAERARTLGDVAVAIHLDATAQARRYALNQNPT